MLKKAIRDYFSKLKINSEAQKICQEIRIASKQTIALMRRDNVKEAKDIFARIETLFKRVNKLISQEKSIVFEHFYKEAVEEYVEAVNFFNFLTKKKKNLPTFVKVAPEEIISGICDFTGELVRRAVNLADTQNLRTLQHYQKTIEDIAEILTKIGFRGKLRQKYDEVERNLNKLEHIIYDIKIKTH